MSNEKHPISELMDSSLQNLRTLVDADTVVGEAITTPDGTVIIPVSKVSFGFASGGSDIPTSSAAAPAAAFRCSRSRSLSSRTGMWSFCR